MKLKPKKDQLKTLMTRSLIAVSIVALGAYSLIHPTPASADLSSDISNLENEIGGYQSQVAQLQGQENTLQNQLNEMTAQINAIQAQIQLSQAKYDKLVADIQANEKKIAEEQKVMSDAISDLASQSTTSPIELLASSNSIGDYIDQQEYSSSVRDQLDTSIQQVKKLKAELEKQKEEVAGVLNDEKTQQSQLAAKQADEANLLAQTQGQEAAYQQLIGQKNSELAAKRAAQAAAMSSAAGGESRVYGASSYPWMGSSMAYDDSCNYYSGGSAADPFGYCKRQCVSYVAWKLNTDGRGNHNYSGLGNAINWWSAGSYVPWGSLQAGDAIVWDIGSYGHVMYVEWVSGDSVGISQMNVPYDSGKYSTDTYSMSTLQNGAYIARRFH